MLSAFNLLCNYTLNYNNKNVAMLNRCFVFLINNYLLHT